MAAWSTPKDYMALKMIYGPYLESQWSVIVGYVPSMMGYFGVQWPTLGLPGIPHWDSTAIGPGNLVYIAPI